MAAQASWAAARDAVSSGSNNAATETSSQHAGGQYWNYRVFEPFDTSALAGATVTAATLELYRDDSLEIGGNGFKNSDTTTAVVVASTQASGTSYANSDYSLITFVSKGSINFASTSDGAYFSITITDLSIISTSGYTKLAVITGRDLSNAAPVADNDLTWQNRSQANPPKLTITYMVGSGGSFLTNFV